jgi:hypothetical protein
LNQLRKTKYFLHTGHLEAFHSLLLEYASKEIYFSYTGMVLRNILAVMDHNLNLGREQIGERVVYCPAKKEYVIKPTFGPKDESWRIDLADKIVKFATTEPNLVEFDPRIEELLFPFDLPANITGLEKPTVQEIRTGKHKKRRRKKK